MSGGSWNYVFVMFNDVADRLEGSHEPLRVALAARVRLFAEAMRAIEWHDSGDYLHKQEVEAIQAALSPLTLSDDTAAVVRRLRGDLSVLLDALEEKEGLDGHES